MVLNNTAHRAYHLATSLQIPTDVWQLWLASLLYYVSLVFVNSNLSLAIATGIYILVIALIRRSLSQALWLGFIATAILTKGKTYVVTLIPKDQALNAVFDVNTILPLYVADAILIGLLLQLWRIKRWQQGTTNSALRMPLILLLLFFGNAAWLSWSHLYGEVIFLSLTQLIPLFFILALPSYLFSAHSLHKNHQTKTSSSLLTATYAMLALVVVTQIGWALAQYAQQAPFNNYIEGKLPGIEYGISTMEDHSLFRATGWFVDPALLGSFLFSALVATGTFFLQRKNESQSWLLTLMLMFILLGIIVTLNRILIVSSIIYCFLWWLHAHHQMSLKTSRLITLIAIVGAFLIAPIIVSRFSTITTGFQPYGSGWYRIEQAIYTWRIFTTHPFGVGLGMSPLYFATSFQGERPTFDPAYPHNIWLQLLAETGSIGMLAYGLFVISIYRPWLAGKAPLTPLGAAALAYLYCAQFYPIFINQSELLKFCFIAFGCYLAETQLQLKSSSNTHVH